MEEKKLTGQVLYDPYEQGICKLCKEKLTDKEIKEFRERKAIPLCQKHDKDIKEKLKRWAPQFARLKF